MNNQQFENKQTLTLKHKHNNVFLSFFFLNSNLTAQASARQSTGQDWTTTAKNLPTRTYTPGSWTFSPSLTIADINSPSFGISVECDPTGTYPIYADCYGTKKKPKNRRKKKLII